MSFEEEDEWNKWNNAIDKKKMQDGSGNEDWREIFFAGLRARFLAQEEISSRGQGEECLTPRHILPLPGRDAWRIMHDGLSHCGSIYAAECPVRADRRSSVRSTAAYSSSFSCHHL